MNSTCKNCINWDNTVGFSGEEHGNCNRLGMNDLLISDSISLKYIAFHKSHNPQAVSTGKNFSCVHYENK